MKLHQLSLFLENRPGQLKLPCRILADAGINILALSLADTQQFGILRLIVRDWQRARAVLESAGCVVQVTEVLALSVEDRPGGLLEILDVLERHNLAIEYMYAFGSGTDAHRAALVFRFEDPDRAMGVLQANGVDVLDSVQLFERAE